MERLEGIRAFAQIRQRIRPQLDPGQPRKKQRLAASRKADAGQIIAQNGKTGFMAVGGQCGFSLSMPADKQDGPTRYVNGGGVENEVTPLNEGGGKGNAVNGEPDQAGIGGGIGICPYGRTMGDAESPNALPFISDIAFVEAGYSPRIGNAGFEGRNRSVVNLQIRGNRFSFPGVKLGKENGGIDAKTSESVMIHEGTTELRDWRRSGFP